MMETFSNRLKRLRKAHKNQKSQWTQHYVADKIGVARSTYTAYEVGSKQPTLDTINKLADLFSVSTDYLLGHSDVRCAMSSDKTYFFNEDKWSDEEFKEARVFIKTRRQLANNNQ